MTGDNQKHNKLRHKAARWLIYVSGILISLLIFCYAGLVYASSNYTLPGLYFNGQSVSFKNKVELKEIVKKYNQELKSKKLNFSLEDESITKTVEELALSADEDKTVKQIYGFGKTDDIFPNISYFKALLTNKLSIKAALAKGPEFEQKIVEFFDRKKSSTNPTLDFSSGEIIINKGLEGYRTDLNSLKLDIESKITYQDFSSKISVKMINTKSNFTEKDLDPYLPKIKELANKKFLVSSSWKKLNVPPETIVSFVDPERTVLSQNLSYSDGAIDDYLGSIAKNFNVKGVKKQVSTLDNAIITEGREGKQLDIQKSRENLKTSLQNGSNSAELEISVTPIQEELVSPGYNPGKYPGKYIEVNLTQQMLYAFEGSNLVQTHMVSTGKWSMPTPQGEFSINNKDPRAYSSKYALYMPYWMAFIGSEYGIHELPEWPDGTKEGESHLGTPVSHGCIRLGRGSAQEVYNWAEIGTIVFTHK